MNTKTQDKPKAPPGFDPETGEEIKSINTTGGPPAVAAQTNVAQATEDDYGADMGAGFEGQTAEDVGIPFWVVLQPTSPEVNVEQPADGTPVPRPGCWLNRSSLEFISGREGLLFVPAFTQHSMIEWIVKEVDGSGGGFVSQLDIDDPVAVKVRAEQPLGKYQHPEHKDEKGRPHELAETYTVYGVGLNAEGDPMPAVISFSSTHIKPYKDWMYKANAIILTRADGSKVRGLPLFAHVWRLHTRLVKKGTQSWYVPEVRLAQETAAACRLPPSSVVYQAAKQVYEGVRTGALKAATGQMSRETVDPVAKADGDPASEKAPY